MKDELSRQVSLRLKEIVTSDFRGNWTVFAKEIGIPQGTMKPWLDGESLPGGKHLAAMAKRGIDVNWLLTGQKPEELKQLRTENTDILVTEWVQGWIPQLTALDENGRGAVEALLKALAPTDALQKAKPPPPKAAAGPARARRK
ncbi:MAG: hypothetical protein V1806_07505 [Pseudomonadota bacterium]